ncbi:hypothetical protein BRADI_1g35483v3 [Brachypodium distachyon]|uniref:Uncharacterized protein n=1 Tax=Brachypodium distachyon TaxID=15368 RepID=A0A2K2DMV5_BRADI|nr:hypothetical protein BRADI_1g35483v3 [Brachypodium distachyon]
MYLPLHEKDDTSCHDFSECFQIPIPCWSTYNGKTSLQNSKGSFNILPTSFLASCKMFIFFNCWISNCLHECGPSRIYAIYKVILHVVVATIDGIIHFWSMPFS